MEHHAIFGDVRRHQRQHLPGEAAFGQPAGQGFHRADELRAGHLAPRGAVDQDGAIGVDSPEHAFGNGLRGDLHVGKPAFDDCHVLSSRGDLYTGRGLPTVSPLPPWTIYGTIWTKLNTNRLWVDMSENPMDDPWEHDPLGFRSLGETYTNLIQSIEDDSKVLSIEAGFGRGKTFFRRAWAQHLRNKGEIVVEIDAQQSDHSGDPVITFLGALVSEVPEEEQPKTKEALTKRKEVRRYRGAGRDTGTSEECGRRTDR